MRTTASQERFSLTNKVSSDILILEDSERGKIVTTAILIIYLVCFLTFLIIVRSTRGKKGDGIDHETIELIENPMLTGMRYAIREFRSLKFRAIEFIPSSIFALMLFSLFLIFALLFLYGFIPVITDFMQKLIKLTQNEMKDRELVRNIPYTVALGLYSLMWVPFFIICIPFYIIGVIGRIIESNLSE